MPELNPTNERRGHWRKWKMKKGMLGIVSVGWFVFWGGIIGFAGAVMPEDISGGYSKFTAVLINPENPDIIYAGCKNALLKSEDSGLGWRAVLLVQGQKKEINFLLFDPKDKKSIYAAGGSGLYHSFDEGRDWERIYRGKELLENECTALAILPPHYLLRH